MRISILFANNARIDPLIDIESLRETGLTWGVWSQWHQCYPHRVLCHDATVAQRLIAGRFNNRCDLYIPETVFRALRSPPGVKSYGGEFLHEIPNPEEIVAMHLAAVESDIVVLVGYDWTLPDTSDSVQTYIAENRLSVIQEAIDLTPDVQWIIADADVPEMLKQFENVDHDTLENIIAV